VISKRLKREKRKIGSDLCSAFCLSLLTEKIAGLRQRSDAIGTAQSRNPDSVMPTSLRGSIGVRLYEFGSIFSTTQCEIVHEGSRMRALT
jgi:hypothetical protein